MQRLGGMSAHRCHWRYSVPQKEFERLKPHSLSELVSVLDAGGSLFL
jgi:hypothetical protein